MPDARKKVLRYLEGGYATFDNIVREIGDRRAVIRALRWLVEHHRVDQLERRKDSDGTRYLVYRRPHA